MKRILFLGAAHFQIPPIEYARQAGYYVLTCDIRPDSPGHSLAHESHNVSTRDHRGVMELARSRAIDGIVCFGSDVSALPAAVVANALGLPGAAIETVETLTRKSLFRQFLSRTGLQQQRYGVFCRDDNDSAAAFAMEFGDSTVIKPVDSSGSKGVSVVHSAADVDSALAYAYSNPPPGSHHRRIRRKSGKQVCGDGYMDNQSSPLSSWEMVTFTTTMVCSPRLPRLSRVPMAKRHSTSWPARSRPFSPLSVITKAPSIWTRS
jgi:biotin carboxylase